MENSKLKVKDLVNIGVFVVIYFLILGISSMTFVFLGMTMVKSTLALLCFALAPFVTGIILGTPVILLMAKLQKPWGFFTFGILSPILLWLSGHNSFIPAVGGVLLAAVAEFILYLGKYKSFKAMLIAYAYYNIWTMLPLADILFVRAKRLKMIQKMGLALVNNVFTTPNVLLILMFALVGGVLGALLGKKMLKKYFTKAGIL